MTSKKILTWAACKRKLQQDRKRRKKIVFTNGCFDILHVGHLKVFTKCKKHGDRLVVAVNSDKSIRWQKGPERPIIPQKDRAEMIAGLVPVDYVVIFNEATPEKLINFLKPDVLIKGGDWKESQIVGRESVKKVVRIPLVKGRSTTAIIQRILDVYGSTPKKKG